MPAGLQVWDIQGNLILDTNDNLGRFLGFYDEATLADGSISISIPSGYTPIFMAIPLGQVKPYQSCADVKITNTSITWKYLGNSNKNHKKVPTRILYGYY